MKFKMLTKSSKPLKQQLMKSTIFRMKPMVLSNRQPSILLPTLTTPTKSMTLLMILMKISMK